jgi:hypothetical protein
MAWRVLLAREYPGFVSVPPACDARAERRLRPMTRLCFGARTAM